MDASQSLQCSCKSDLDHTLTGALPCKQVQQAHKLEISLAHAVSPVDLGAERAVETKRKKRKSEVVDENRGIVTAVTLDIESALAELKVMGAGIIEEVWIKMP